MSYEGIVTHVFVFGFFSFTVNSCFNVECQNGGLCVQAADDATNTECLCTEEFYGPRCEHVHGEEGF